MIYLQTKKRELIKKHYFNYVIKCWSISGKFSTTPGGASGDIKKIALKGSTYNTKTKTWVLSEFDKSSSTSQAQLEYTDSNKYDVFINLTNNIFGKDGEEYTLTVS